VTSPQRSPYLIYAKQEDDRTILWLTLQYVSVTIPGHQAGNYSIQNTLAASTYLLPVTIAASIRRHPSASHGDYAAYIGIAPPQFTQDRVRVAHILAHGNKIEKGLAEHLFRKEIDRRFGEGAIVYRA
jgi:hypothetical protein